MIQICTCPAKSPCRCGLFTPGLSWEAWRIKTIDRVIADGKQRARERTRNEAKPVTHERPVFGKRAA